MALRDGKNRIRFAEQVEQAALRVLAELKPGRRLDTNVEFYTALLLDAIGLPRESFTAVFAMGRVVGWTAHNLETGAERKVDPAGNRRTSGRCRQSGTPL